MLKKNNFSKINIFFKIKKIKVFLKELKKRYKKIKLKNNDLKKFNNIHSITENKSYELVDPIFTQFINKEKINKKKAFLDKRRNLKNIYEKSKIGLKSKLKEKFKVWKKCDVFTEYLKNMQDRSLNKNYLKNSNQNILKKNYSFKNLRTETSNKKNISTIRYLRLGRRKGQILG